MGRKCTQALFNALFISDIRIDFMEYRKFRAVKGGYMKTGLPHQSKQTDCFQ